MKLLLDTCAFLWIAQGSTQVSPAAARAFLDSSNETYMSAASVWEIVLKYSAGKLSLLLPPDQLLGQFLESQGAAIVPVDLDATLHVAKLPLLHRDPFDRLLIAQAILNGFTIVTPDTLIAQYPVRTLW